MRMNPTQCRLARAALDWTNSDLAEASGLGVNTISRFEQGADVRMSSVEAMQRALEEAGIIFIGASEASLSGGAGLRLRGTTE